MDLKLKQALSLSLNSEFYYNKSILKIIEKTDSKYLYHLKFFLSIISLRNINTEKYIVVILNL
jgi:hypothetical protein